MMKLNKSILFVLLTILISSAVNGTVWPCESTDDCTPTNSYCDVTSATCECNFGQIFSDDSQECASAVLYGDTCKYNNQCNLMPSGASCREGVCKCQDGFTYVKGKCRQLSNLNEDCNDNTDCNFGYDRLSVVCEENKCVCANGYYERYINLCRPRSMAVNDPCVVHADCEDIQNGNGAKCENLKCVYPDTRNRRESREIAVQTSIELKTISETPSDDIDFTLPHDDETKLSGSGTSNTISSSSNYNRLFKNYTNARTISSRDENGNKEYGSSCDNNGQSCGGINHSICLANKCYCNMGYYHKNGRCMAELGEIAETKEDCEFEYNVNTKVCECIRNYFYEANMRSCRKPITLKLSCTSDSQCSPFGGAFCDPDIPRRCECRSITKYNEEKQLCEYREGLGAPCERNDTCTVQNTYCSNEGACICNEGYKESQGECIKQIGTECSADNDCKIANSVCEPKEDDKTCQCKKGFVHFKDECHKEAVEMNEECAIDDQCKPLLASCKENTCQCKENQHVSLNRCEEQKVVGESCSRAGECYMPLDPESIECRNSVCKCKVGYKLDTRSNVCMKVRAKNSSGRPSALKVITILLIASALGVTASALNQAFL